MDGLQSRADGGKPAMIPAWLRSVYRALRRLLVEMCRRAFRGWKSQGPPLGIFSALLLVRAGKTQGAILLESQNLPAFDPQSVTKLCRMGQESGQPWPLFWCRLGQTRLVGPSLCPLNEKKEIMVESAYGQNFYRTEPSFNQLILHTPEHLAGPWTSLACRWDRGYYHWFMDVLPRLTCLSFFPPTIRCLMRGPQQPFQTETLMWLGLKERFAFTDRNHFVVEDYFYAGLAGMSGCVNPWKISFLRERLGQMSRGQTGMGENIYIFRRGKTRGLRNEEEVEDFFKKRGWSVVDTEQLTVAEQAGLFARAKRICTLHGAALTNLIWARAGTQVLELLADNFLNGVYEGLAKVLDLNYSFRIYQGDRQCRIQVPLRDLEEWMRKSCS